jgi:hypothetical protein
MGSRPLSGEELLSLHGLNIEAELHDLAGIPLGRRASGGGASQLKPNSAFALAAQFILDCLKSAYLSTGCNGLTWDAVSDRGSACWWQCMAHSTQIHGILVAGACRHPLFLIPPTISFS